MLRIGNIVISSRCLLAPLAGISDLPFRLISREHGCEFAYTEMISGRSLVYDSRKTLQMLMTSEQDTPLGLQLLGAEPDVLAAATVIAASVKNVRLIDFNAACPVSKVVGKGEGAALMKDPPLFSRILGAIVKNTTLPVTVKLRAGWDDSSVNAPDFARRAMDAGVSSVTIHGRTRMQGYQGSVDYAVIRQAREAISIPLIGSGDALSPLLIKKMFNETGCDGVSIARGALGNPWIFREADQFLREGILPERPSREEVQKVLRKHLEIQCFYFGESRAIVMFRKLFSWYVKSLPNIRKLRERAFRAIAKDEMTDLINEITGTVVH